MEFKLEFLVAVSVKGMALCAEIKPESSLIDYKV